MVGMVFPVYHTNATLVIKDFDTTRGSVLSKIPQIRKVLLLPLLVVVHLPLLLLVEPIFVAI